ncbi:MAG: ShlB/FhaC/HecB family hemolysin secretion/activation protein [Pseudomonadales bacterium]
MLPSAITAAVPDRTTIPAPERSALSRFAAPLEAEERDPVLPRFQPDTGGPAGLPGSTGRYPVRDIRVTGARVLDPAEIESVVGEYRGRALSFQEMIALRDRITARYVDAGYVTSGAVLESLDDGVLHIDVVEGALERIEVHSAGQLRPQFVADYLSGFGTTTPVNVLDLEERLQILQQDPHVSVIEAQLLPGPNRGESVLLVSPGETERWGLTVEASNQLSPAIGAAQGVASLSFLNLTGRTDDLSFSTRAAEGLLELMGEYDFPLGARGARMSVYAFGADSDIVRGPFHDLDIGADTFTGGTRLRWPVRRTLTTRMNLLLAAEWRESKTFLLGQGFSFIEGPEDGKAVMTILRGGLDYLYRNQRDVIYARVEASAGVDALGATVSSDADVPDGRFAKLWGQFQWARRLPWLDSQLLLRLDGQVSNDPLFGIEQYPVGGRWTVRGYRENTLIRDNAVVASVEWRWPLFRSPGGRSLFEVRPFADWSRSANVDGDEIGPATLASVGVGAYWSPLESLEMEVYWGDALNEVTYAGDYDLQDDGIHFRLTWGALP